MIYYDKEAYGELQLQAQQLSQWTDLAKEVLNGYHTAQKHRNFRVQA